MNSIDQIFFANKLYFSKMLKEASMKSNFEAPLFCIEIVSNPMSDSIIMYQIILFVKYFNQQILYKLFWPKLFLPTNHPDDGGESNAPFLVCKM